jgi:hypothetical protein
VLAQRSEIDFHSSGRAMTFVPGDRSSIIVASSGRGLFCLAYRSPGRPNWVTTFEPALPPCLSVVAESQFYGWPSWKSGGESLPLEPSWTPESAHGAPNKICPEPLALKP